MDFGSDWKYILSYLEWIICVLQLRVFVLSIHGTLKRLIWLINSFPSYSLILWILNSPSLAGLINSNFIQFDSDFLCIIFLCIKDN